MADRWAVQNGNWSDTSTWNGGTLPTSADDVFADGKTVTIDQNITVLSLRTTQRSGGTAGGSFACQTTTTINVTGSGVVPGTTTALTWAGTAPSTLTVNGNVVGSSNTSGAGGINMTASGAITVNGNVTGQRDYGINGGTSTAGNITVVGNVATSGTGVGILQSGGTVTIIGDVRLNVDSNQFGTIQTYGVNSSVSITGNVIGQTAGLTFTNWVISISGANATFTLVGNIIPNHSRGAVVSGANGAVSVTGNISGGLYSSRAGLDLSGASSIKIHTIVGTCTATTGLSGGGSHAITDSNSSGGWVAISGSLIDSTQGDAAIYARRVRVIPTLNTVRQYTNNTGFPNGTPVTYGSLDYIPNNIPVPANVRSGTVYGNNQFTGTLAVPPANSVASGVPVDNTTGTAALRPSDIAALIGAQITAALNTP